MAIKKGGISVNLMGEELKRFLKILEEEERSTINLGETTGPLLDLYETAENIVVEADIPGVDLNDLEVCILHGLLTIEGVKKEKIEAAEKINYLCMERSFESFKRVIKIMVPINPKQARAVYSRGVLTITFPKVKEKRGEAIKIKVEKD
ncbi:MAG: Hsp20/alpha crystallin family protein [Nitrospirota bacterium]